MWHFVEFLVVDRNLSESLPMLCLANRSPTKLVGLSGFAAPAASEALAPSLKA